MKHFQIEEAVMDFEAGMWSGFRAMFPCVRVKGCVFHWVQAVWRHIQGVGLQEAYNKDAGTHTFLRKLMALPFIPHEHVLRVFLQLASLASDEKLKQICTYIHIIPGLVAICGTPRHGLYSNRILGPTMMSRGGISGTKPP